MKFRRGFKTLAERISAEVRGEMNLSMESRLDPSILANHLSIPVLGIRNAAALLGKSDFGQYFLTEDVDSFSAITVFHGRRRIVIHNENHAPTRQASNIAHEVSHCLLEHEPEPVLQLDGCRYWNEQVEAEAAWLSGALLVPREGVLRLALSGLTVELIARHFGVSPTLCRWRMNGTGVASQLRRNISLRTTRRRTFSQ